jgi:hypothetical protein
MPDISDSDTSDIAREMFLPRSIGSPGILRDLDLQGEKVCFAANVTFRRCFGRKVSVPSDSVTPKLSRDSRRQGQLAVF